jgi:diacylglycerol kinase (ATP)
MTTKPPKNSSMWQRFSCAISGLTYMVRTEGNCKVYFALGIVANMSGFYFHLNASEWIQLWTAIALVAITEAINTAIEYAVDLSTSKWEFNAKVSKDVAAGAVLLASIYAIVVAYLLFFDRFVTLMSGGI